MKTGSRGDNTIVVLGGGIGGLTAASTLKEKLGSAVRVVLIERKTQFQFTPSYPWLMVGMREPSQVQKSLGVLGKKGIEVVEEEVISIDLDHKLIKASKHIFNYDYLIIALGAEYAPSTIPGFSDYAHHIYDLDSALKFRKAIEQFKEGTIAIGISRLPFKCPAAPYEVALLLDSYFTKKGVRDKIKLEFFTPEATPMPAAGPEIGSRVIEFLKAKKVNYHPKLKLTAIKTNALHFENGERMAYDLLFCVPPHAAPKPVVTSNLTNETGWIPVNPRTLETGHAGVYAVGDVASIPTPHGYAPALPKAGVFAHEQAKIVANNIAVAIRGIGKMREWGGHGACFLETGNAQGAFVEGNFLAAPRPDIRFHMPGRIYHMQKILFEKYWMDHWL